MADMYDSSIRFNGNLNERDDALAFIDTVIRTKGHAINVSGIEKGVNHLAQSYLVSITDDDDSFEVMLSPTDASDSVKKITFEINKKAKMILMMKRIDDIDKTLLDDGADEDLLSDI